MAKARKKTPPRIEENVSASLDRIETAATEIDRAHGVVAAELSRQRVTIETLEEDLAESEQRAESLERSWRERHTTDVAKLEAEIKAMREKFSRVAAVLG